MKSYLESINKHIEEVAEAYIVKNKVDRKNLHVVQEFSDFQVKAKAEEDTRDGIAIKGYLSTFKNVDRHNDIVKEGAFDKTIKKLKKLPMLRDHSNKTDDMIGSWVKFKIDDIGLYVEGFISKTKETEHLIRMIEDGHLDTLSMGGLFRYAEKTDSKGRYLIEEVILLEGSVVCMPANEKAIFSKKSLFVAEKDEQVSEEKADQLSSKQIEVLVELKAEMSDEKAIQAITEILKEQETQNEH
jgi:HK97 family phage prohead protease